MQTAHFPISLVCVLLHAEYSLHFPTTPSFQRTGLIDKCNGCQVSICNGCQVSICVWTMIPYMNEWINQEPLPWSILTCLYVHFSTCHSGRLHCAGPLLTKCRYSSFYTKHSLCKHEMMSCVTCYYCYQHAPVPWFSSTAQLWDQVSQDQSVKEAARHWTQTV